MLTNLIIFIRKKGVFGILISIYVFILFSVLAYNIVDRYACFTNFDYQIFFKYPSLGCHNPSYGFIFIYLILLIVSYILLLLDNPVGIYGMFTAIGISFLSLTNRIGFISIFEFVLLVLLFIEFVKRFNSPNIKWINFLFFMFLLSPAIIDIGGIFHKNYQLVPLAGPLAYFIYFLMDYKAMFSHILSMVIFILVFIPFYKRKNVGLGRGSYGYYFLIYILYYFVLIIIFYLSPIGRLFVYGRL